MATILVVEDQVQQREEIERALVQGGHVVDTAPGGNRALHRLKEVRYDLLVTDLMMDEGTGFDVLEWVTQNAPGLPIVICSSYAKPETLRSLLSAHLYRILRKPFRPEELMDLAGELLGQVSGDTPS